MSKQYDEMLPNDRKFRMLRVKRILERETDSEHSITMTRLLELLEEESESDRRTLYDDIRDLEYLGTEVKIDKSVRPPHLSVVKRQFSLSELKLIIDAIASSKFLTMKASQDLIDKLKQFCSRYEASELNRQTLLANRAKRIDDSFHNNVSVISSAIDKNKKISFSYFRINTRGKKQFNKKASVISPWATIYTDDKYYMIGFDSKKGQKTTYRIDRMTDITILDEQQDGEEEFKEFKKDLPFRTQSVFNMFGDEKQWVTLRAPLYYYYAIEDKFGSNLVPRIEKDKRGTEYVIVDVPVAVGPQFFAWVFGMENYITIVGPDEVVKQMGEMLRKVSRKYNRYPDLY
jgi:predicted DNA-binding transcriptional regulator YafY